MSRRFTKGSSEFIQFSTSGQHFTNWGFGTLAVCLKRISNSGSNFQYLLCNTNAASTDSGFAFTFDLSDRFDLWSATGSTDRLSTTSFTTTAGWGIVAITKTTGTTTARAHFFSWTSGTWTHENFSGTSADNTDVLSPPSVQIGEFWNAGGHGDYLDAEVAAVMALTNEAMTDSQIERLPAGLWDRWLTRAEDFLIEFPSGRDPYVSGTNTVRTSGRATMKATSTTGTTRGASADPPGFRFSKFKRRR